jgi:hypothetical protein
MKRENTFLKRENTLVDSDNTPIRLGTRLKI